LKYGEVLVDTPSVTFKAGETVEGIIHLHIKDQDFPTENVIL